MSIPSAAWWPRRHRGNPFWRLLRTVRWPGGPGRLPRFVQTSAPIRVVLLLSWTGSGDAQRVPLSISIRWTWWSRAHASAYGLTALSNFHSGNMTKPGTTLLCGNVPYQGGYYIGSAFHENRWCSIDACPDCACVIGKDGHKAKYWGIHWEGLHERCNQESMQWEHIW